MELVQKYGKFQLRKTTLAQNKKGVMFPIAHIMETFVQDCAGSRSRGAIKQHVLVQEPRLP